MARIHFILDPTNPGLGEKWPYEQKAIEEITQDFEIHLVRGKAHAEDLAKTAAKKGASLIVCAGNDSIFNEIVNALYPFDENTPALSIYPGLQRGSLATSIPFCKDFKEFLKNFLQNTHAIEAIDLAKINFTGEYGQSISRVFVDSASFGFASLILSKMNRADSFAFSFYQFLKMLFRNLPFYSEPSIKFLVDNQDDQRMSLLTGFINNTAYTSRGLRIFSESDPTDGTLEFTVVKKARFHRYIMAALPFYTGRRKNFSFFHTYPCKKVKIEAAIGQTVRLDFDGECRGFLPAEIEVKQRSLKLVR